MAEARAAVDAIHARGRPVLVTGGSGFYLRCFFAPVADEIAVDPAVRAPRGRRTPSARAHHAVITVGPASLGKGVATRLWVAVSAAGMDACNYNGARLAWDRDR